MTLYAYEPQYDNRFADFGDWELNLTKKGFEIVRTRAGCVFASGDNQRKKIRGTDLAKCKHPFFPGQYVFTFGTGIPFRFITDTAMHESPVKRYVNDFGHVVWKWVGFQFTARHHTYKTTESRNQLELSL